LFYSILLVLNSVVKKLLFKKSQSKYTKFDQRNNQDENLNIILKTNNSSRNIKKTVLSKTNKTFVLLSEYYLSLKLI
jgi:hypothetical protein